MIRRLSLALSLLALINAAQASASAIVIWPIDPVIKAGEQAATLWLENKGNEPVTMQVRAFAWSQADGTDVLNAQDEVVASPPIARVEAGKRQLVRIIRRSSNASVPEGAYRLVVDELPPPPPQGSEAPAARLAVQMRYSVPLFTYTTADKGAPRLKVRVRTGEETPEITLVNTGTTHARLTNLRTVTGGHETVLREGLVGYVLAGATMTVPLPAAAATATGTLRVAVNGVDQSLTPDA